MRFRALLLAALATLWLTPASADMVITQDVGGSISQYARRYAIARDTGERVVIDGLCLSACTMFLGIVPHDRVCVTGNALLGFHAARLAGLTGDGDISPTDTQRLYNGYPHQIRAWIARHGGLKSEMIFLQGGELRGLIRGCAQSHTARAVQWFPTGRTEALDEAKILALANRLGL